ncbi:HTH-type transcriptional regulator KipR [Arthrobacter ulcerisalmonis]|uniref:HTH-type transcriptional regulator KipR n=2 Tax=Arthrobacter ulcerisalmonis TaxID=2483813 RepID=A0A3P5XFE7_9MICC|nr:HTH-type transcriptional regulator KipR [Arthrobacter ulcerisalmonis]
MSVIPATSLSDMTTEPGSAVIGDNNASRFVEILLEFSRHRTLTAAQITKITGIPASAVYRHLTTLVNSGFVAQTKRRGQYSAGPESLRLAANFHQESMVKGRITEQLLQLSEDTEELAAYLVVSGVEALCVEAIEGPQMLRCSYSPGRSQPLHKGASALVLLAHLGVVEQQDVIGSLDLGDPATAALQQEIQLVRDRGFALSYGAVDAGVWGVSFPVIDDGGRLLGAVSTMAPAERAVRREKHLIASTRDAALALAHEGKELP